MTEVLVIERKHLAAESMSADHEKKCRNVCREHVTEWQKLSDEDINLSRVTGGLTNILTKASISKELAAKLGPSVRSDVLIRHFGEDTDLFFDRNHEGIIFRAFSDSGVGPKFIGSFEGGRLEEYLDAATLTNNDCRKMCKEIGAKLAEIHNVHIDEIPKEPSIFNTLTRWLETAAKVKFGDDQPNKKELLTNVNFDLLGQEIEFLKKILVNLNSPVVFCHNDFLAANLMRNYNSGEIHVIDFEYGNYNYRGYDFGNHFCEWGIDYSYSNYPYYQIKPELYPNYSQREEFFMSYLTKFKEITGEKNTQPTKTEIEQLQKEGDFFMMVPHFAWGLWSIVQAGSSKIQFGYMEYALERIDQYFKLKQGVITKYQL